MKSWAFLTQEADKSTSEKVALHHGFSFHSEQKPWFFFWVSPHHNCSQTSRNRTSPLGSSISRFMVTRLKIHIKWSMELSTKEGNNYNPTNMLRYDERHTAEDWITCRRSGSFPGTIHTVHNMFRNVHMSLSLPSCCCIPVCSNHLFVYKEGILIIYTHAVESKVQCWCVFKSE